MSVCPCESSFPERTFKTASDADDFMSRVRLSPVFRYVGMDGAETQRERYRCRQCGADWACVIPPSPPFTWGPLVARRPEPQEIQPIAVPPPLPAPAPPPAAPPRPPPPAASPAQGTAPFLEVGPRRVSSDVFTLVYEDEAADEVPHVLAALYEWRPGVWTWKTNAGLEDIEIEIGPPLKKSQSAFDLFGKTWKPELINPAWRGLRGRRELRPVHMRGIRKHGEGSSGFLGEYYLIVVDTKARKVSAWMMAEAR